ncbi:hypothetical protein B0H67DRAFT_551621 [Lasiosphaeris hirsuta]|uniref:Uncharacterized protein n=1 Tax=Lasiosphaeris hirsuta TaxID=260670 RepID=A0AA40ANX5_9PEZI|nr:hypothetical protein B0H67DRAFT_551621 [Lasiosphaeris hirsuta]
MASTLVSSWSVALLETSIITIQILTAVFATIMHLTRCIPLPGLWDPTVADKTCWSDAAFKAVVVQSFVQADDGVGKGMGIALWASIEAQMGIIAACIPCLRGAFARFRGRVGLATTTVREGPGPAAGSWHGKEGMPRVLTAVVSQSEEDVLGNLERGGPGRINAEDGY